MSADNISKSVSLPAASDPSATTGDGGSDEGKSAVSRDDTPATIVTRETASGARAEEEGGGSDAGCSGDTYAVWTGQQQKQLGMLMSQKQMQHCACTYTCWHTCTIIIIICVCYHASRSGPYALSYVAWTQQRRAMGAYSS
jgi:hypothetical protein